MYHKAIGNLDVAMLAKKCAGQTRQAGVGHHSTIFHSMLGIHATCERVSAENFFQI